MHTITSGPKTGEVLAAGDWFRLGREPGQAFRFHLAHEKGHVVAYGGDLDPKGRCSWRSFYLTDPFIPCKAPRRQREV